LLLVYLSNVQSQISVPGIPESFSIKTKASTIIPEKVLDTIDIKSLLTEDSTYSIPNRYGIVETITADIKLDGVKIADGNKGNIWQYRVTSANAISLGIQFVKYKLPPRAKVFIYDDTHHQIFGAFTEIDNNAQNQLTIAEFKGREAIIEYFEPNDAAFSGELEIGSVSQAYKDIQTVIVSRIGINCPDGAGWQDVKHAVCRMTFSEGRSSYYCTGFLVNNVRIDGTPYFQTANHCISTAASASTLVTYFNFENSTCASSDAGTQFTLSGATLKATSTYSDFSLLLLNQEPPTNYLAFFSGWDNSGRNPSAGTCIHHPEGTPKCIALDYTRSPYSYGGNINWDNNFTSAPNTHWTVQFDKGNTEPGSSGSPLFDQNKRVIGQLHGGDSVISYYGKFSLSWNHNNTSNQQLMAWLDPDRTGALTLDGTYARIKPVSAFSTPVTNVCVGAVVNLTDLSKYFPNQWSWSISPDSYTFVNNTNSNSENPQVKFNSEGDYSVSLTATNSYGKDSINVSNYIVAKNNIRVLMSNIPADTTLCGGMVLKYPVKASGALQYTFNVERTDKIDAIKKSDSIYLSLKPDIEKDGSFNSWLKVEGAFGQCKASDSAQLRVVMQSNNNIENALRLWPGQNVLYSNQCATVQTNEPHPPYTGCYTNDGWCSGGGASTRNTVWFTFFGPSSGHITIDTHGLNNRISVYEANSYADIISGNSHSYKILGANEGRSSSDLTSEIENLSVEPGKTYWLQLDGSNGAMGNFSVDLVSNSLDVFPNPSNGLFDVIISNINNGNADIAVYSLVGKLLFKRQLEVTQDSNHFHFDLSTFPGGLYVVKASINGTTMKSKLMIVK